MPGCAALAHLSGRWGPGAPAEVIEAQVEFLRDADLYMDRAARFMGDPRDDAMHEGDYLAACAASLAAIASLLAAGAGKG